ncbi:MULTISPECIES: hypothetical protein [Streptococcus]|uniref:hypothetical protein n=1 Tax=Streptococcus TaxID=1301 RepID=UPI0005DB9E0B|nr:MULTISPECIES: hypothetical protein [Streptococcus]MBF9664470.1 hypothetical protein [Streptococcus pseudopneumoniae]MBF9675725.1 hypothetical protein [Streptococcus pseudopneumoniae]MBW8115665.1 hypothetical protein [Streptococcus pseudopneumoniae]NIB74517.1 hypothetical protein [Streptococcus pseudopneumoniae]OOR80873.1 hypothetical protein B0178_10645 [Streptococcus pseudopneumoniae]
MREYFVTIFEEILSNVIFQIGYVIGTMYYLHELGTFNKSVKNLTSPVEVMFKDNGKAWWLLAFALILTVIAGLLLWYHAQVFSRVSGYSMATLVLFILILVLFMFLIFKDINNPILRMAIIVIFGGSAILTAVTS